MTDTPTWLLSWKSFGWDHDRDMATFGPIGGDAVGGVFYRGGTVPSEKAAALIVADHNAHSELRETLEYADLQLRGYGQIDPKIRAALAKLATTEPGKATDDGEDPS